MSRIIRRIREGVERFLTAPRDELGRWARFGRYQIRLWRLCGRRLREHNAATMAAALVFRTLFAMIPTLVLFFLVLKSFGTFNSRDILHRLLQEANLEQISLRAPSAAGPAATAPGTTQPATAPAPLQTVAEQLERLVNQIGRKLTLGRIGPIGVVLLIWSALGLLTSTERSLNRIFEAPRTRSLGRRVLLYWSAVTLVPVALVAADYVAALAGNAVRSVPGMAWILLTFAWAEPIIAGILLLAAVYVLMPNARVRFGAAIAGAVVAVPLYVLAKWGFSRYVAGIVEHRSIYGAMGLIPLFLIWLYVCWLLFLFGAELAYASAHANRLRAPEGKGAVGVGPWDFLAGALAVAIPQLAGKGPVPREQVLDRLGLPEGAAQRVLAGLADAGVICAVAGAEAEAYVLGMPADTLSVAGILGAADPTNAPEPARRWDRPIAERVSAIRRKTDEALASITLADLVAGP